MSKPLALATLLVGVALLEPAPLRAQLPGASTPEAAPAALLPGPGAPVALGVASLVHPAVSSFGGAPVRPLDRTTSLEPVLAPAMAARHHAPGVVLMIVGGAGILLGVMTEEDVLTVIGAGVGLYGLYLYLR